MDFERRGRTSGTSARAGGTGGSDRLGFARELLRLSRAAHLAAAEPVARKRAVLDGLRRLVSAGRATSVVTEIDPRTGRPSVVSAVSVNGTRPDDPGGSDGEPEGPAAGGAAAGGAAAVGGPPPAAAAGAGDRGATGRCSRHRPPPTARAWTCSSASTASGWSPA